MKMKVVFNLLKLKAISLVSFIGMLCLSSAPTPGLAKEPTYPRGDGKIRIYSFHLGEIEEIQFRHGGKLPKSGMDQINHLLRSRDSGDSTSIDPRLLDLLDHLQDYFGADTIEIISGFRSSEFNEKLLEDGHQVSQKSYHTQGRAIDFHIDEIKEETLRAYLESLELGGVGYYGSLDFIHIDTGPYRTWGGSEKFARKLIGILDAEAPIQLTSDKNDYLPEDKLYFTWNFSKGYGPKKVESVRLEHFWRGDWVPCSGLKIPEKDSMLPISDLNCPVGNSQSPFGKYRWIFKLKDKNELLSSNEFYLKKK
jgi:uncharacterized protein YcbK (DUF882 family)